MAEAPNADQFKAFARRAGEGPVVMLNLLKFKADGGAESYARYAREVQPLLERVGARATYMGRGAELLIGRPDEDWDAVLLVQYPTRQALLDMVMSDDYRAIQHFRDDALVRSVLLATDRQPIA